MNGRDLALHIAKLRPGVKVLFMSGYAADIISKPEILTATVAFIQKPFNWKPCWIQLSRTAEGRESVYIPTWFNLS